MKHSFNLVDEPFIPCVLADGKPAEMGLRDTLCRAHEVREVRDGSPLVTAALHRLLLAILHRVFGPKNLDEWKGLWGGGRWGEAALEGYWDRWRGRFDLFDGERPFYQAAGFRAKKLSSINRLAHELASGNNPTLFDHTSDADPPPASPALAARLVIAQQAWGLAGLNPPTGNLRDAPLVRGVVVLPQGRSLFETLALNLIAYNAEEPIPSTGEDVPAWEREGPRPDLCPDTPAGYLDYLTWQSRLFALHPEEEGGRSVVRRVSVAQGRKLGATELADPMMAYERNKEGGWLALRLREERELWRDSGALF